MNLMLKKCVLEKSIPSEFNSRVMLMQHQLTVLSLDSCWIINWVNVPQNGCIWLWSQLSTITQSTEVIRTECSRLELVVQLTWECKSYTFVNFNKAHVIVLVIPPTSHFLIIIFSIHLYIVRVFGQVGQLTFLHTLAHQVIITFNFWIQDIFIIHWKK